MDDTVVLHPSSKLQAKSYVWLALIWITCFLPFVFLGLAPGMGWTFVGIYLGANALWLAIACLLIPPYYRSISYELRPDELVVRRGILTKSEDVVPYRTVTNVAVKRGLLDRWLGIGAVLVHTAGFSQQTSAEATLAGLASCQEVRDHLMAAVHRRRGEQAGSAEDRPLGHEDVPEILQGILDEIRALRDDRKE
jgi:membrane protein YdbS with pleckstrin-like domain